MTTDARRRVYRADNAGGAMTTQTGRTITLDLPLPPREASPNWRGHWSTRAKAAKAYREACGFAALAARQAWQRWHHALWEPLPLATLCLTFTYCGSTCPDDDNAIASFKAGRDALVDAGLIVGDAPTQFRLAAVAVQRVSVTQHPPWQCPAGVRVMIREEQP